MKRRIFAALLALSVSTLASVAQSATASGESKIDISSMAPPERPATEAQIREYLALNHAVEIAQKAMIQMIHTSRQTSTPYLTPGFWDDMEKAVLKIDFVPMVVPAYQKYISQEDMAAIIAFYRSPAGQRILASQSFIASAVSDAARKAGEEAGREVGMKHADEIQRLMQQAPQSGQPSIQVPNLSK